MFRFIITGFAALLFLTSCQTSPKNSVAFIPNSKVERFHLKYIGDYKVTTYWPNKPAPKEGWPIIYLLDGNSFFFTATDILASQTCDRCTMQDGVVVAIDYFNSAEESRRALDYLPKPETLTLEVMPNKKINFSENYGGADAFFDFLTQELKPEIEKRFTINPHKQTIFGHSYGGLFVMHAFLTKPIIFNTYIASSPSMWFSGGYIFDEVKTFLGDAKNRSLASPVNLLISVGGDEQSLIPAEKSLPLGKQKMLLQHRQNRKMVGSSGELFKQLKQADIQNLQLNYTIYPNQTHKTVPIIALQDGLQASFQR